MQIVKQRVISILKQQNILLFIILLIFHQTAQYITIKKCIFLNDYRQFFYEIF